MFLQCVAFVGFGEYREGRSSDSETDGEVREDEIGECM